jgi:hypothetical protein
MKRKCTYKLLMQSEEKGRNILETALYGLVALSVIVSIWQFAEQPLQTTRHAIHRPIKQQFAS